MTQFSCPNLSENYLARTHDLGDKGRARVGAKVKGPERSPWGQNPCRAERNWALIVSIIRLASDEFSGDDANLDSLLGLRRGQTKVQ